MNSEPKSPEKPAQPIAKPTASDPAAQKESADRIKEIGGRRGPEPTRYGDWENGGKCVDF